MLSIGHLVTVIYYSSLNEDSQALANSVYESFSNNVGSYLCSALPFPPPAMTVFLLCARQGLNLAFQITGNCSLSSISSLRYFESLCFYSKYYSIY